LGIATLNWNWSFKGPILIGDRIHAVITIAKKRPTKRADRGIVTLGIRVLKQTGETVQEGESQLMMRFRNSVTT
jgi:acyl dehydratase